MRGRAQIHLVAFLPGRRAAPGKEGREVLVVQGNGAVGEAVGDLAPPATSMDAESFSNSSGQISGQVQKPK